MTVKEAIDLFIKKKILVLKDGQYVLKAEFHPKTSKTVKTNQDFEKLLIAYRDLWPAKVKTGNRSVRQSLNTLKKKLQPFVNRRKDIPFETILDATSIYVAQCKRKGYEFMICSDYFIIKNGSSELESMCDLAMEGELKGPSSENLLRSLN